MSRKMKLAPLTRREMLQLSGAGAAALVCASLLPNLAAADVKSHLIGRPCGPEHLLD